MVHVALPARLARSAAALALALAALATPLPAAPQQTMPTAQLAQMHVLVLNSFAYGRPSLDRYIARFVSELAAGGLSIDNVFIESLDLNRNAGTTYRAMRRELLLHQYGSQPIDLIVAIQQPAMDFLARELPALAPAVPVMTVNAVAPAEMLASTHRILQLTSTFDMRGTLALATKLLPDTEQVVMVNGVGPDDLRQRQSAVDAAASLQSPLRVETTEDLTVAQMLDKLSTLPPHTIVLGGTYNLDKTGARFVPLEINQRVLRVSNRPVFTFLDAIVGQGAVGGAVFHVDREAASAAATAVAILDGRQQLTQGLTQVPTSSVPMFDWQQLERWHLDASRLPPSTFFVNKPLTLWDQYRKEVIAAAVAFAALASLSIGLLLSNRRRRLAK
jgi:two-component system sensor histidine kinase/response regulator